MSAPQIWDGEHGQPPMLQRLIGLKVIRAWLLPENRCLFIRLEGDETLMAERIQAIGMEAISFQVGKAITPNVFEDCDDLCGQNPHVRALRGMALAGMDGGKVLMFKSPKTGELLGAEMGQDRVRWVREDR